MAHLILEFSDNLGAEIAPAVLFETLHEALAASGVFPLAGLRSRAYPVSDYRVADGRPGAAFVNLTMKIGPGRSEAVQEEIATMVFDLLNEHLKRAFQRHPLSVSFEMAELRPICRFNRNNLAGSAPGGGAGNP